LPELGLSLVTINVLSDPEAGRRQVCNWESGNKWESVGISLQ
jgi:hypothetical protein